MDMLFVETVCRFLYYHNFVRHTDGSFEFVGDPIATLSLLKITVTAGASSDDHVFSLTDSESGRVWEFRTEENGARNDWIVTLISEKNKYLKARENVLKKRAELSMDELDNPAPSNRKSPLGERSFMMNLNTSTQAVDQNWNGPSFGAISEQENSCRSPSRKEDLITSSPQGVVEQLQTERTRSRRLQDELEAEKVRAESRTVIATQLEAEVSFFFLRSYSFFFLTRFFSIVFF